MDTDKEVTRRLLDGHEGSSYTDLPGIKISKDGSLAGVEALHEPEAESETGTSPNPFADPEVAERYAALYEKANYECRHVFDPTMTWTREEERRLVRKIDAKVCLWAVRPPTLSYMYTPVATGWSQADAAMHAVRHVLRSAGRPQQSHSSGVRQHARRTGIVY
jgi:hypothetical protein